ncbi:MAG: sigma factor-like helix-turn-helix DNA-binding protein [Bacteroidales bacterium]|nr:hypothetical protein [Lentimicrobiaceae bacterium]MDD5695711.1 sigma factor-like helix-turn-helix DNA-binding protein [Bacteroidales bacterium]
MNLTNYHIEELQEFSGLSERTKNVCIKGSLETLYKILLYYLKNGDFKKIRNCGEKTNLELIALAKKYVDEYQVNVEDLEITDEDNVFEKFKFFCFENFGIPSSKTEVYRNDFLEKRFPYFKYFLLIFREILNEREYFIFEHNFGFFSDKAKMTLQSIGDLYHITRERIRQISQLIPYKIEDALSRFTKEQDYLRSYFPYKLNSKNDFILIDQAFADKINTKEELELTPKFYSLAFSIFLSKSYSTFQDRDSFYENYYLIKNECTRTFDFSSFYDDLYQRINKRIDRTYKLDLDKFMEAFLKENDPTLVERIRPICIHIAQVELQIEVDSVNQLVFSRNTLVKLSEYIIDILEKNGKPMQLRDIHQQLLVITPKTPHNIESLRSSILSIDKIIAIGKTSTYSLKKWTEVKTGTIKELVTEYLSEFNEPRHISDVTNFVVQYRDTSDKNILSNLKLDRTNTFIFFRKGYIGLRSKKYKRLSGKYGQLSLL